MANITWSNIKDDFNSWDELKNSNITWNDFNKETVEIYKAIQEKKLIVPEKFKTRIDNLCRETINTYNKYSDKKYVEQEKQKLSLYEKISIIFLVLSSISDFAFNLINVVEPHKEETNINITINDEKALKDDTDQLKEKLYQILEDINNDQEK